MLLFQPLVIALDPAFTLALAESAAPAGGGVAHLFSFASLMALLALASLEIVLGIDNIVFIAIITGRLPEEQQAKARRLGIGLAAGMRILLLIFIAFILRLTTPLFDLPFLKGEDGAAIGISGKDLVLLLGGLFLIAKATWEIHHQVNPHFNDTDPATKAVASFTTAIVQILLLDLVFSLDSVITAAGMTKHLPIMITAVLISVSVMLAFAGPVSRFVENNPSLKILALAFLVLIGVLLTAEGLHQHFQKGYVYFAMAFALGIDLLQMRQSSVKKAGRSDPTD